MISIKEIEKLAELSRIALSTEEKTALQKDMDSILEYVDQIKSVSAAIDTEKKAGAVRNVFREDGEPHKSGIFSDALLAAVPNREGNYIRVKKIL
jgi:aspartyl/glutamyl-tRNA(Asn/Gln) amidotransferase C subunit